MSISLKTWLHDLLTSSTSFTVRPLKYPDKGAFLPVSEISSLKNVITGYFLEKAIFDYYSKELPLKT